MALTALPRNPIMPKAGPEMVVITKVYDLVLWSCNHIARFPRSHRFTLGDRLEVRLLNVLEMLLRAKYTRNRLPILRDANLELELLRFQFRLAKDLRCLSLESYGYAARTVEEVGRVLGGWIKRSGGSEVLLHDGKAVARGEAAGQPVGPADEFHQPDPGGRKGQPG